jgi:predicted ABC-type ATPase
VFFAGPNGSGKSTFIEKFPIEPNIKLGIYINADEIEKSIYENGYLNLDKYNIHLNTKIFKIILRCRNFHL